ncbi:hypothetical protein OSTOST_10182, partial [Ostertagia ostertagi]
YSFKLEKGEYVAQVEVRHPDTSQLELLTDTPLHVRVLISPTLNVDLSSTPLGGENAYKWANKHLTPSQQVTLYAGSIPDDKLPKTINIVSGSYMTGSLVVMSNSGSKAVDKTAITYIFTEYSTRPSKALSMVTLKEKKPHNEEEEMNGKCVSFDIVLCLQTEVLFVFCVVPFAVFRRDGVFEGLGTFF